MLLSGTCKRVPDGGSMCVLQMEYLAQMLSAVGIGVAPETLQSIQDEPSEITGPITPPRVAVQPAPVPSTCTRLLRLRVSMPPGGCYTACMVDWLLRS